MVTRCVALIGLTTLSIACANGSKGSHDSVPSQVGTDTGSASAEAAGTEGWGEGVYIWESKAGAVVRYTVPAPNNNETVIAIEQFRSDIGTVEEASYVLAEIDNSAGSEHTLIPDLQIVTQDGETVVHRLGWWTVGDWQLEISADDTGLYNRGVDIYNDLLDEDSALPGAKATMILVAASPLPSIARVFATPRLEQPVELSKQASTAPNRTTTAATVDLPPKAVAPTLTPPVQPTVTIPCPTITTTIIASTELGECEAAVDAAEAKCPDDRLPEPLVGDIDAAIEAVEAWYGDPQDYFEISANLQRVSVIVASGERTAEQAFLVAGEFVEPAPIGEAEENSQTFTADQVDFDPDTIFHDISNQLDCPVLIDFAITGSTDGVLYDATVASSEGGVLLILLGPDGEVRAAQES